jgi:hypothetical protein
MRATGPGSMCRWLWLTLCLISIVASAERRFALLVGANDGWATDRSLRYAHDDARRVEAVLLQLAQVSPADATLLQDPTTRELDAALTSLEHRIEQAGEPTLFFFYYSGHSDASAIHLRGPLLAMSALAERLSKSPARLTLAVIDSCRSGAILGTKGANPVAPIQIGVDITSTGFALLSSSGADELAQESKALAGSIFTHHWVSALRGAGDVDGDGVVRLTEAYAYAYERTRVDTESSALPQRPGFKFSLKGHGDVALTRLVAAASTLEFEVEPSQRYVIVDSTEQHLIAEGRSLPNERRRLQLASGAYRIKRPMADGVDVADVTLKPGEVVWATSLTYRKEPLERGFVKGAPSEWGSATGPVELSAALAMFQRALDEDPAEERARKGKARVLLAVSVQLQEQGKKEEELKVLTEAMALDPTFRDAPSVARFADRAKVLRFEVTREKAFEDALKSEIREDTRRIVRPWGLGFALFSTKGIVVIEAHWVPKYWLTLTLAGDVVGPGVDLSAKFIPLKSAWSPTVALGAHYGFRAWNQKTSSLNVNGMPTGLTYDDIWGKMFHADFGIQWMSSGGFAFDASAGPMLFFNEAKGAFEWFGFLTVGVGLYFK